MSAIPKPTGIPINKRINMTTRAMKAMVIRSIYSSLLGIRESRTSSNSTSESRAQPKAAKR
jgi:hypothetical protein